MENALFWMHCKKCLDELPAGTSPKDWAKIAVAVTQSGEMVVWCNRHEEVVDSIQLTEEQEVKYGTCTCTGCHSKEPCNH